MSACPPVVVSGLPNMTPIFWRSWLVKMTAVLVWLMAPRKLAQRLGHQAGLHAHGGIAHVAFDLGARDQRGHRVDHDHIHRAGADEGFGDLERLFTGIRLGDEQVVNIHADTWRHRPGRGRVPCQ